jgi:hypothetical protein
MNHVSRLVIVCCAAAVCISVAQPSSAQVVNPSVKATFSSEVALPNATLPAGTYRFEIRAGATVAVFNEQGQLITLVPVSSVTRAKSGSLVVLEGSRKIARVVAVYPDGKTTTTGYAFQYKKDAGPSSAQRIASPRDVSVTKKQ